MVKLYTDLKYFDDLSNGIRVVDPYFNLMVTSTEIFSDKILEVLKKYEKSEIITDKLLNGRFGPYRLNEISTGVKTLILLILIAENKIEKPSFINISECGINVLSDVIYYIKELDIPVYFRNSDIIGLDDFDVLVNNQYKFDNIIDLLSYLSTVY